MGREIYHYHGDKDFSNMSMGETVLGALSNTVTKMEPGDLATSFYFLRDGKIIPRIIRFSLGGGEALIIDIRILYDVYDAETLRWAILKEMDKMVWPSYRKAFDEMIRIGQAHYCYVDNGGCEYRLYTYNPHRNVSSDFKGCINYRVVKKPAHMLHQEVSNLFVSAENELSRWNGKLCSMNEVFKMSFYHHFEPYLNTGPDSVGTPCYQNDDYDVYKRIEIYTINNREYWFYADEPVEDRGYKRMKEFFFPTPGKLVPIKRFEL